MTTFVAGVGGQVGALLAERATAAGLRVVGGSAHPERVGPRPYEVLPVDLNRPDTLGRALQGATSAFLYPAAGAVDELVEELVRADLEHVVMMTSAAVELPAAGPMARQFRVVEDAVRSADLPWTLLRPDAFAGNTRAWARQIRASGQVSLPYPEAHVVAIHEADIVDAALAALTEPRHVHRAYLLTGPESLTQRRQVELVGRELGRPLSVVELTREQWREEVRDTMPGFVSDTLLDFWAATDGRPQPTDHTVQRVTGQQPRTFASWVAEHADVFRGGTEDGDRG